MHAANKLKEDDDVDSLGKFELKRMHWDWLVHFIARLIQYLPSSNKDCVSLEEFLNFWKAEATWREHLKFVNG